jgi:hypothetical protein
MMPPHTQRRRERRHPTDEPPAIRLHIERLAWHGVPPVEAGAMTAAFEAELTRLAAAGAVFRAAEISRLQGVSFAAAGGPARSGRAAAAGLWRGVLGSGRD